MNVTTTKPQANIVKPFSPASEDKGYNEDFSEWFDKIPLKAVGGISGSMPNINTPKACENFVGVGDRVSKFL